MSACRFDTRAFQAGGYPYEFVMAQHRLWQWTVAANPTPVIDGTLLNDIVRFRDGPCANQGAACTLDTYTVFVSPGGAVEETATVNGILWRWVGGSPTTEGTTLAALPLYSTTVCANRGSGSCSLDTHSLFTAQDGATVEVVTSNGRMWAWHGGTPASPFGAFLESVERYAEGPCANQPTGGCRFDSHEIGYASAPGLVVESVTVGNLAWNWDIDAQQVATAWPGFPIPLDGVARYAAGPCGPATSSP